MNIDINNEPYLLNYYFVTNKYENYHEAFNKKLISKEQCLSKLENLFFKLCEASYTDISLQKIELSKSQYDITALEKYIRLAFGRVYEYYARYILKFKYGLDSYYNNSRGNYIDLASDEDKRVFDVKIKVPGKNLFVGLDVKYATHFFNGTGSVYNTAFHIDKLYEMSEFHTKKNATNDNFVQKSFVFAFVPNKFYSHEYTKFKETCEDIINEQSYNLEEYGCSKIHTTNEYIHVFYLDKSKLMNIIIDCNGRKKPVAAANSNLYIEKTTPGMSHKTKYGTYPTYAFKYKSGISYTVQDFINNFVK